MKKINFSIAIVITSILIMIFALTVVPFAYITVSNYNKHIGEILENYTKHTKNISSIIIENEITNINNTLDKIKKDYKDNAIDIDSNQYESIDLIFSKKSNGEIKNYSQSLYDTDSIIDKILKYNVLNDNFIIVELSNKIKYLVLLSNKEIVDRKTNRVLAYIYAGKIINDNYSFINNIRDKSLSKDSYIYIDNKIISTTSRADTKEYEIALDINNNYKGSEVYIKDDILAYKNDLDRFGSNIVLISVHSNEKLELFQDRFNSKLYLLLVIDLFILIAIYYLVKRYITYPLNSLLNYANSIGENEKTKYSTTNIKEFNKIAKGLKKLINDLRDAKEQYQIAIDGTQDGLWDWNLKENTIYYSKNYKSMLGFKEDEFLNVYENWENNVHPDDKDGALKEIDNHIKQKTDIYNIEFRLKCKNGKYKWILSRGKALFDKHNIAYRMVGFHTDIDKIKRLEIENKEKTNMMFQQSKLASMGEMVGNIAHQWRQPLNIIGAINMKIETKLEFEDKFDSKVYAPISKDIVRQLEFMSKTIDDFRDFFTQDKEKQKFSLQEAIDDVYSLVNIQYTNHNIDINIKSEEELYIYGLKNELKQVIINILNNAKDAIIENNIKDGEIIVSIIKNKDDTTIQIEDNGGGIKDDIIDKIFEPYFTTKFKSKGTGIGLYMSYQIITEHMDGMIYVKNKNNGACFRITLPLP